MVLLKRGKLIHSSKRPTNDYILTRSPENITIREVLHVLEEPLVGIDLKPDTNRRTLSPVTHRLIETWARKVKAMEQILDETTLADLCKPEAQALMYYI